MEAAKNGNRNLELSSRNIDGLELVRRNEVHPYHLLRYDRAIFSQPAIEKLQVSLKNSVSSGSARRRERREEAREGRRGAGQHVKKRRRWPDEIAYQIIRRPVITEKGLAIKENQNTLVFQVAPQSHQDGDQGSSAGDFQSESAFGAHRDYPGKERRRGKFAGYRPDWKKAYVRLKSGEKMPEYAQNL